MNQMALIRTQLMRYFKIMIGFMVIYAVLIVGSFGVSTSVKESFQLDGVSYLLGIYLMVETWLVLVFSITFYSYHAYSRRDVLNKTILVQLLFSFISGLLLEGHNALIRNLPILSFAKEEDSVRVIYVNRLIANEGARFVLSLLFITLIYFVICQLANLLAVLTYGMKRKKFVVILSVILIVILAIIMSTKYWTSSFVSLLIGILGILSGTGQSIVPSIVIPTVLMVIVLIVSMVITNIKIKTVEIQKITSI